MNNEKKHVEQVVSHIPLPACPEILIKIDELIASTSFDFGELSALIKKDVALSAGLIKLSNSPLYCLQKNASIPVALQMIGAQQVAYYARAFLLQSAVSQGASITRFWDSSWRVAEMSANIARLLYRQKADEIFTFGLFRDVGIAVLMNHYSNYKEILGLANNDPDNAFTEHENREYSVNHAQIGAFIAEDWHLPDYFVAAIQCHHTPDDVTKLPLSIPDSDRARELIAVAQLAEHAVQLSTGLSQTHEWSKLKGFCMDSLQLSEQETTALISAGIAA
ncbi:MAG: HDOD domain-containing protein [Vogesella sp.]|uniref:HDOD domain-containing protein n=1 Tax=Vogesella sp. TaxID=1904252 RepID=UPI00391942EE